MQQRGRRRPMPGNAGFGPIGQQTFGGAGQGMAAPMGAGQGMSPAMAAGAAAPMTGGMGAAAPTGPVGNAAPMGAAQDIMRGLQALGQYASGGEVC
jgi:hypothetical protein